MDRPPAIIVLDMGASVKTFMDNTMLIVSESNLREIVTQIVQVMLNEPSPYDDLFRQLPDFNRMTQIPTDAIPFVRANTFTLANDIYHRLVAYQAFSDSTLDYFFDTFLDSDLVLHRLPH